jgi:dolichol kinase
MKPDCPTTNPFEREVVRKLFHLPVFLFPVMARASLSLTLLFLATLILAYLVVGVLTYRYAIRVGCVSDVIRFCTRKDRLDLAPVLMALGFFTALCLFRDKVSLFPAYVIVVADTAAALVGMRFGRHPILSLPKTWEGSAAFCLFCLVGAWLFFPPATALLVSLILTVLEALSLKGTDNFTLPVAAAFFQATSLLSLR